MSTTTDLARLKEAPKTDLSIEEKQLRVETVHMMEGLLKKVKEKAVKIGFPKDEAEAIASVMIRRVVGETLTKPY